jgi:PDZ domain-containing protein
MDKSRQLNRVFSILALLLAAGIMIAPCPYIISVPGPTVDVLGKQDEKELIKISNHKTFSPTGDLYLVTVSSYGGPGEWISPIIATFSYFRKNASVLPTDGVYGPNATQEGVEKEAKEDMDNSQNSASVAALRYLGYDVKSDAPKLPIDIKLQVDSIGGPSAGLAFSLGIIDKLSDKNLAGGKKIAATGTIDDSGKVGKIGGVLQKVFSVRRDGATLFLIPKANCSELKDHIPSELLVAPVTSLDDAIKVLENYKAGKTADIQACS